MATLADAIERYLKHRLSGTVEGVIEIRRAEVAERFDCVPSQINYVLETRFTPQRGYYVESRRGGGGYIRILGAVVRKAPLSWEDVCKEIGTSLSAEKADGLLQHFVDTGILSKRHAVLMRNILRNETRAIDVAQADQWRARLLRSMLMIVWHDGNREEGM